MDQKAGSGSLPAFKHLIAVGNP